MSREDLVDLEFFLKLLSFKLSGFGDLDNDMRMDLVDEGDTSFPDPVYMGKLVFGFQDKNEMSRRDISKITHEESSIAAVSDFLAN